MTNTARTQETRPADAADADAAHGTPEPVTHPASSIRASDEPIEVVDLGTVDYVDTWRRQADAAAARAAGEIGDQLWALEHPSTYTAGKRTQPEDRPDNGLPVVDVDRGGRITWHGPGQLVCYPIVKLAEPLDVVDYVRRIEEAVIHVVRGLGLDDAGRVEGRSGVWLPAGVVGGELKPSRKVAAIGIRVTHGVTMHGVSLNCDNTLDYYGHIVPCGIADAGVTTLSEELGRDVTVADLREPLVSAIAAALDGDLRVADHDL
ncbi:lipoyl(octanoyl) transferase LipB [Corynebacterium freneyi]|uniref:lipoyl(octanoyl) transferase LipB n=1 Tax=Corynebacterium freneyi TaxID=134034 RepID=UPI001CCE40AC|nr:lipoyl(octanoyl) transferase LipB [Corynebacterium freneyi]UBI01626.1 lipoyl(octanoyl) transferase LipB [Corynebacterium freneyi]